MRRDNLVENSYIAHIDRKYRERIPGQGEPGEDLVVAFFNSRIAGLETRLSTMDEDAGLSEAGKAIDTVSYLDGEPVMVSQVYTGDRSGEMAKRLEELKSHSFVRLKEMKREDTAIPKVLIPLDAKSIREFSKNPDFEKHPEIAIKIIDSCLASLKLVKGRTKIPAEQDIAQRLILKFEEERKKLIH